MEGVWSTTLVSLRRGFYLVPITRNACYVHAYNFIFIPFESSTVSNVLSCKLFRFGRHSLFGMSEIAKVYGLKSVYLNNRAKVLSHPTASSRMFVVRFWIIDSVQSDTAAMGSSISSLPCFLSKS